MIIYRPYTYAIYHPLTNKAYYGVRYSATCSPDDLWKTYFTSSKYVKRLIEEYGRDSFQYEVRKVFTNKIDAINWEHKVLRRLKVRTNSKWLNIAYHGLYNCNGTHSEETRKKISTKVKGRTISTDQRNKVRATLLGRKRDPETIAKIKATKKKNGYRPSTEHILAISSKWRITYPNGRIDDITNLRQFSLSLGLSPSGMREVSIGKRKHYKNFLCQKLS